MKTFQFAINKINFFREKDKGEEQLLILSQLLPNVVIIIIIILLIWWNEQTWNNPEILSTNIPKTFSFSFLF